MLFPKPPPESPLPLDDYLNRTDRAEVGRSAFFCGRDTEFEVFRNVAVRLKAGDIGGGTMICQGAPGAGKTALMLECMEAVRCHSTPDDPWVAVLCRPETLMSPAAVVMDLIEAVNEESQRLAKIAPDALAQKFKKLVVMGGKLFEELSSRGFGVAGFSVGGKSAAERIADGSTASARVFSNAASLLENFHHVIFVDEAQNTPVTDSTRGVIDCLHNPPNNLSLVAAFFGLSDTQQVLRQCGLSRFADERVVNLEPLSMGDAIDSFRRLLDAYFTGDEKVRAVWVNELAKLSQGWPQHINRIGVAAGRVIRTNEGHLEEHLIEQAVEKGIDRKNAYYLGRVEAGSNRAWVYKQLALAAGKVAGELVDTLSYDEVDQLTENARTKNGESIDEFLINTLHAGLLAPVQGSPDRYKIPIPSLKDYLQSLPVAPPPDF